MNKKEYEVEYRITFSWPNVEYVEAESEAQARELVEQKCNRSLGYYGHSSKRTMPNEFKILGVYADE